MDDYSYFLFLIFGFHSLFIFFLSLFPFLLFTHINANANAKDFDEWIYSLMLVVYIHTSFGYPLPVSSSFPLFFSSPPFLALRLRLYSQPCSCSIRYVQPTQTHNNIFNVLFYLKISLFLLSFFLSPPLFLQK